jgi:hypothetical protein
MVFYAVPRGISERISGFSSLSYNQRELVAEYVTGLIASGSKSALGISRSIVGSHYKSLERLLTEYPFSCRELNWERLALLEAHNETRSSARHGVLIVDDTGIEKEMPMAHSYYDHVERCYKRGFVLVTLGYGDRKTSYPVDVEDYVPRHVDPEGFRTKIEVARGLIERNAGRVRYRFVVFDSWYLCNEMHSYIRGLGKDWISRLKSDRLVLYRGRYIPLAGYAGLVRHKARVVAGKLVYARSASLKSIGDRVKLVVVYEAEETIYLASSLISMKAEDVLSFYSMRFLIDVFHRDAKQHLGLGEWKVRSMEGARRHWHLLMLAYTLLRLDAASDELARGVSTMGKSIARQVRLYGFLALMELVWLATKNSTAMLVAEFLRNGGIGMG